MPPFESTHADAASSSPASGIDRPVGNSVAEAWANLLAGRSGIGRITRFDASALRRRIAGEVKGFDVADYMPAKEARHMDTFIHYGLAAAMQAMHGRRASTATPATNAERIGVMHRLRHRRPAADRGDARPSSTKRGAAPDLAVLRARHRSST